MIPLTPVKSSNVAEQGYDPASQTLAMKFANGKTYHYKDVPPDVAQGLVNAESIGRHFAQHIRGKFEHELVADDGNEGSTPD